MSSDVKRLKALLLDDEQDRLTAISNQLTSLAERLDRLESASAEQRTTQAAILTRLDDLHSRAGTRQVFDENVAASLSKTLAEVGSARRDEMIRALSPAMAEALRAELATSKEQIAAEIAPPLVKKSRGFGLPGAAAFGLRPADQGREVNGPVVDLGRWFSGRAQEGRAGGERAFGPGMIGLLLLAMGVPLLAWFIWARVGASEAQSVEQVVRRVIADTRELTGYQTDIEVTDRGNTVTLTGLMPSPTTKTVLLTRLETELPNSTRIVDQLQPLPYLPMSPQAEGAPDLSWLEQRIAGLEADIVMRAVTANLLRARDRLTVAARAIEAAVDRGLAPSALLAPEGSGSLSDVANSVNAIVEALDAIPEVAADNRPGREVLASLSKAVEPLVPQLEEAEGELAAAINPSNTGTVARGATGGRSSDPLALAEGITLLADRIADQSQMIVAVVHAPVAPKLDAARPTPVTLQTSRDSSRQVLQDWTRTYAIFFSEGTSFRSPERVAAKLDELGRLLNASGTSIRIVGYTDERGGSRRNNALAMARANAVRDALIERGVAGTQLIAVGRADARDLSNQVGPSSPNRRVEFEMAFIGEMNDADLPRGTAGVDDLPTDR